MWDLNEYKCCSCSQPAGGRKISTCFSTVFSPFSVALNLGCFLHWISQVVEESVWEGLKQTISIGERLPRGAAAVRHNQQQDDVERCARNAFFHPAACP